LARVKAQPFEFKQSVNIIKATGRSARTLRELSDVIKTVCDESIFHHMFQYFMKGHVAQYTNDFAHWVGEDLEQRALSEHLSNIDPYAYGTLKEIRDELVKVIDFYLETFPEPREVIHGEEFFFNETIVLTFPMGVRAKNLAEFLIGIKFVDVDSIYFHFYEARVRLGSGTDDFSMWVETTLGKKDLAAKLRAIDPFMHTVEEIREHIIEVVEQEVKADMEELQV